MSMNELKKIEEELSCEKKEVVRKQTMEVVDGNYTLNSIQDQAIYANYLIDKKMVSNSFKDASQLIVAIQLCKDLKIPSSCLKDFYVVGGRPAIFGDTFVALALSSGVIEDHTVKFYDEEGEIIKIPKRGTRAFSCVVSIKRRGSTSYVDGFYSWDDREFSGNSNDNYRKFPNDMLFRRAMGRAIKWACADAIRGIEMGDYLEESSNVKRKIAEDNAKTVTEHFNEKGE